MLLNPFVTNGYAGGAYFCDRVEETRQLTNLLTNGNNVALMSARRIGKTDLIHHCFAQPHISQAYYTFIIDIYSTHSVRDMVNRFGRSIIDTLRPRGKAIWEQFLQVASSIRSEISFDINGQPIWGVGLGTQSNPDTTLDEIFNYLSHADKPCLVAIDEFQQIGNYGDGRVEPLLRTYIQQCPNAHFIFSGSRRHLMSEMFTLPSRPFYQSVTLMNLHPLAMDKYQDFAAGHFTERGKQLDADVVPLLFVRFDGVTSYIQRIMNALFMRTPQGGRCAVQMVDEAIEHVLDMASDTYDMLLWQIPEKQRDVLLAICREGKATNIKSGQFAKRHKLTSPSSVQSAIKGLLEKDLITMEHNTYSLQDKFFALWLSRRM